ncbi:heavy metal-associated isoprenylated plant protein 39-like isoform X1 [Neltuma alba]|uniref:heavy metal-associated isoprenylated plant protein 39-like isoform X1 n=2 Tax=Neltuma alba TaxID=207710 RepID=UPI0010A2B756|nr:heavy metal-associated isoprenylated plant protein 39-like isoform X1 [Prosopis alba]
MQKIVLKVELHDEKLKQKAMRTVSGIQGVDSVSVDMNENKMTVVGGIDPVIVAGKLRKLSHADILSVEPVKDEPKKEEPKKEEPKKPEEVPWVWYPYNPPYPYCYVTPVEQNPVGCVIL